MTTTNHNPTADSILSFRYGESTHNPIALQHVRLELSSVSKVLPVAAARLQLTLSNAEIPKDISSQLKLQLPPGASVKRLELQRHGRWYPATAVPARKSQEIVYREKEAKRAVAATETTTMAPNLFTIQVSPLPYRESVRCRLEILLDDVVNREENGSKDDDAMTRFAQSLSQLGDATTTVEIVHNEINHGDGTSQEETKDPDEMEVDTITMGGAVVGTAFGQTHFVCQIPPLLPMATTTNTTTREETPALETVALLWDTSASVRPPDHDPELVLNRWMAFLHRAGVQTVDLHTFHATAQPHGTYSCHTKNDNDDKNDPWQELRAAIRNLDYDGGSWLADLPGYLCDNYHCADANTNTTRKKNWDAIFIVTDGVDNVGQLPQVTPDCHDLPPVHCWAVTGSGAVNRRCLGTLAALSPGGTVVDATSSMMMMDNYYDTILNHNNKPRLVSIVTNQDEEAFVGEVEDGFSCVPDYRVATFSNKSELVDPRHGARIAGILGNGTELSSVTRLTAKVAMGTEIHEFHFRLQNANKDGDKVDAMMQDSSSSSTNVTIHRHDMPTVYLSNAQKDEDSLPNRMLGQLYAQKLYDQVQKDGIHSGMDMTKIQEELAATYGFCSTESSLLLLYNAEQFLDHGILPPLGHPARAQVQGQLDKPKDNTTNKENSIGGPKSASQLEAVQKLAQRLQTYMTQPVVPPHRDGSKRARHNDAQRDGARLESTFELQGSNEEEGEDAPYSRSLFDGAAPPPNRGETAAPPEDDIYWLEDSESDVGNEQAYGAASMALEEEEDPELDQMIEEASTQNAEMFNVLVKVKENKKKKQSKRKDGGSSAVAIPEVAAPRDPKKYMEKLMAALKSKNSAWHKLYEQELKAHGGHKTASPSFFLNTARVLSTVPKFSNTALRVATNCLETGLDDVQLLRSVGYLLLSIDGCTSKAMAVFDRVRGLAPCEPISFLDSALSRFLRAWSNTSPQTLSKDIVEAQGFVAKVLTHYWADRFSEVEWPAMILLHYISQLVCDINASNSNSESTSLVEWPSEELKCFGNEGTDPLRCNNFDLALCVWLGWDTDKTDIDLHVKEPSGIEVYYSNKEGTGSLLSRDFTQGYGPEVYILKNSAAQQATKKGETFEVLTKYFSSHQDSKLTGSTSAVVWMIKKQEDGKNQVKFNFVRLNTNKQKNLVATVKVERVTL
eukprot:CAMPEP_0168736346 /NCGR_PEP_ID=MMETSP0724-20121128/9813_1 /TAXON_ID=265536 /ORGANISM="Amphiprora sp., Strain CCMP467" /LENGTH=1182 /DNA_ID=CAMNT_0008783541 /DNA_START=92 /DNA_END=3640 /DNA_ORIENTATION=-